MSYSEPNEKLDKYLHRLIAKYGAKAQIDKAQEECAELIVALNKLRLKKASRTDVAKEIADVRIMVSQLEIILDVQAKVQKHMNHKIKRALQARL